MTLGDFITRLKNLQKDIKIKPNSQVQLGKAFNSSDDPFEYFDIKIVDSNVILVPSDRWDRPKER